jgi:CHAT domain-containing protein/Tfp pilus assembly protein PilF
MKIKLLLVFIFALTFGVVYADLVVFQVSDTASLTKCLNKAKAFSLASEFDSAVYYYRLASRFYFQKGDTANSLKCDYLFITGLGAARQDSAALSCIIQTGIKFDLWFKHHLINKAEYQYELGEKYTDNLKYDSAVISYKKALPVWLVSYKDSVKQIKDNYKAISYAYTRTGQNDSAIFYLQKVLEVYPPKFGFCNRVVENAYLAIGNSFFLKGEIDKSLDFFRKALRINLSLPRIFESDLAWTYNSLGISYYVSKDYNLALVYIRKALDIFGKIYGEQSEEVAWANNNIGICYQEMKDVGQAYDYQKRALNIRLSIFGDNHPDVASSYNNLGVICEDRKDYNNELIYFKKALKIRKHLFNEINQDIALTYLNIGSTYMLLQAYDSAFFYYDRAMTYFSDHSQESAGNISEINVYRSRIYTTLGNYTAASENINKSIEVLELSREGSGTGDNEEPGQNTYYPEMIRALENKAHFLKMFYKNKSGDPADLEKCLPVYRLISEISDRFSSKLQEEGAKLFAEENAREIFSNASKVSHSLAVMKNEKKYDEMAFWFAEKARASVLSESIRETGIRHYSGIPDSLLSAENKLRTDKEDCERRLIDLKKASASDSVKLLALQNRYFDLTSKYQQLVDSIEIKFPVYKFMLNKSKELTVGDVFEGLDSKTALLEYLLTDDSLFIFAFNNDGLTVVSIIADSALKQKIYEYPRDIRKLKLGTFAALSSHLYKNLIKPVKNVLEGREKIIIIPDGDLFYIPFETLITEKSSLSRNFSEMDYLLKHFDISYNYSVNLWLQGRGLSSGKISPMDDFVGFAPVFKKDLKTGNIIDSELILNDTIKGETTLRSASSDGHKFNELVYSEKEISSIVQMFKVHNLAAKGLLFEKATEENFKKQAGKYKYVHIASHGFCDDKEPKLSGIAFYQEHRNTADNSDSSGGISRNNDGILFSGEIYSLSLNADLVVLSACESGAGRLMKGEGIMGLSRGFISAGASNIIFSLWKTGDLNTSQLMTDLYKYMFQDNSYAHALRLAKLNFLNSEATSFPKFWSSFELIGQ